MPTVPSDPDDSEDMTSLASVKAKPKMVGLGDASFPIGQVKSGTYQGQPWQQFRSVREEVAKQTAEEQNRFISDVPGALGGYFGPGWDRMIKEGPKSKNIQQGETVDPTQTEIDVAKELAKPDWQQYFKEGPKRQNVLGLPGPSDAAEALYGKRKKNNR